MVSGFRDVFGASAVHVLRYDVTDSVAVVFETCEQLRGEPVKPVPGWGRYNVREVVPPEWSSRSDAASEPAGVLTETQRWAVTEAFHPDFDRLRSPVLGKSRQENTRA